MRLAPIQREPLIFPTPIDYRIELPWVPPQVRDYMRGNAWGVTMVGAQWVPGASTRHPERILSWLIDRYPLDFQIAYFKRYAQCGYTHIKLSLPDSLASTTPNGFGAVGSGRTLAQFVETCLLAKRYIPYVQVCLGSKYFQPWNMSAAQWAAYADPFMEALTAAKAADEFILGWEWDLWNMPGKPTIDAFKYAGQKAHAAGCSFWMHYSTGYTSFYTSDAEGGRDRFGFYDLIGADVDGLNYQTDPTWDIAMLQARIVDSLWQFGVQGNRHKFRLDEDSASLMFDNDRPNEQDADTRGYAAMCTIDNVRNTSAKVWGYDNGARKPDGWNL